MNKIILFTLVYGLSVGAFYLILSYENPDPNVIKHAFGMGFIPLIGPLYSLWKQSKNKEKNA